MIRLAEEKDFAQLAEMRWQHAAEDDVTYGETNIVGVDKETFIEDFILFLKNTSTYKIFVMEEDGIIFSAMYAEVIRKVPTPKENEEYIAYLTKVYTLEEYRNKGIGTELLTYIKSYLRENNCELIIVWPSDNSVDWYLRNEFSSQNDVLVCGL